MQSVWPDNSSGNNELICVLYGRCDRCIFLQRTNLDLAHKSARIQALWINYASSVRTYSDYGNAGMPGSLPPEIASLCCCTFRFTSSTLFMGTSAINSIFP